MRDRFKNIFLKLLHYFENISLKLLYHFENILFFLKFKLSDRTQKRLLSFVVFLVVLYYKYTLIMIAIKVTVQWLLAWWADI